MRIAQIAPLTERVPPEGYGGTELVVSLLTEELVQRGHQVTLFATADSVTNARLIGVVPEGLRKKYGKLRHRWIAFDLKSLLKLQEMRGEFDIVHNHMGYQALPFLDSLHCPIVTTNHNPVSDYCADIYMAHAKQAFVAISESYRRNNYPDRLNYVAAIYNGIDLAKYQNHQCADRKYLLFIGRISQDKGTAEAIKIAQGLNLPLMIAGKIDHPDKEYFDAKVAPHLSASINYVGEVNEKQKIELYRQAIAVLYPINFEEPFGLVAAESLACGRPVLGLDRGAIHELLIDKETGIIGKSAEELISRFGEIQNISEEDCQARARLLFSKERMTDQYEALYFRLVEEYWQMKRKDYDRSARVS